jgi:transcriptional regulator with XRE-family HTH domain
MDVNTSTIQRYEAGTIDNTKKLILEGLAEVLHVSVEWLKGETDDYESKISDKRDLQIRDLMSTILEEDTDTLSKSERDFIKDILIHTLQEYDLLLGSFRFGCENFKNNKENKNIAKAMEFSSTQEYNEIMFLREITHSVNAYNDIADVIRLYSKDSKKAEQRLRTLMSEYESGE